MARLSQTNPDLVNNPTLGEATTAPYLDQAEAQTLEDHAARIEGREPRTVLAKNRYPQFMPSGSVPSDIQPELEFVEPGGYTPPVAEEENSYFTSESDE